MTKVHFTDPYLLTPANPVSVNLIGTGGTGSQALSSLARINHALIQLSHPGLSVKAYDADRITLANLGRQLFSASETGMYKSAALINRINRFFGINWKAITENYNAKTASAANITISCVDTAAARFAIAEILASFNDKNDRARPIYWMDFGNARNTGQVILSTTCPVKQPASEKFEPVDFLPAVTDEFKEMLLTAGEEDSPSCSLAEALTRQDLFINSSLAAVGASLLWSLFREGMIFNRGFLLNIQNYHMMPMEVGS